MSVEQSSGTAARMPAVPLIPVAVASALVQAVAMIPGYNEDDSFQTSEWLVVTGIALVLALVLFRFVVPGGGAVTALVLVILGVLTIAVFWAMLSLPLSVAGLVTALRAKAKGDSPGRVTAANVLGALAVVGLFATIVGDMAN